MNFGRTIAYFISIILIISGFNGFIIEEGILHINRSILNLVLDGAFFLIAIFSIQNTKKVKQLFRFSLLFLALTLISYFLNYRELGASMYFNGLREFFPYFLFPIIYLNIFQSNWRFFFIQKFNTFLYFFLTLQIPVSLYQFSLNGAGDTVGGTQGAGYSGILTFTIFLATYYLMTQKFDERNVFRSFLKKSYLLVFWLPTFINETKISFVLIPLFVFFLVKLSIANIRKYVLITIILFPLLFLFNSIYQKVVTNFNSNDFLNTEFLENYLDSDSKKYDDIPRFQKIVIFMAKFNREEILFGKGLGQFKGGTTVALTPFASKYEWLLQGSRPMLFFLLVQVGIIGTILFIFYWFFLISFRERNLEVNYGGNLIIYATACFIIIQLYNDSLRSIFFSGIIMYIICYAISPKEIKDRNGINADTGTTIRIDKI